jgi:hypothetical protein
MRKTVKQIFDEVGERTFIYYYVIDNDY